MFLGHERTQIVQDMILAETTEERMVPLQKLLELQRSDFIGILKAMDGLPVTIRLLDPPLHEFYLNRMKLPKSLSKQREMVLLLKKSKG